MVGGQANPVISVIVDNNNNDNNNDNNNNNINNNISINKNRNKPAAYLFLEKAAKSGGHSLNGFEVTQLFSEGSK